MFMGFVYLYDKCARSHDHPRDPTAHETDFAPLQISRHYNFPAICFLRRVDALPTDCCTDPTAQRCNCKALKFRQTQDSASMWI